MAAPGALLWLATPAGVVPASYGLPPLLAGLPLPSSVPAPLVCWLPPVSTVELAAMIAWRNGCTPNETLVITAIPASNATGRSQPTRGEGMTRLGPAWPGGSAADSGTRRSRGQGSAAGLGSESGHAQCPRQVEWSARLRASAATLTSHGRGGRLPILARIRSSPSVPGPTLLTAAARARRSACSRLSSGPVMPSPCCPPHYDVSCVRIALSDAIARAVWLFTAPLLMPIALAMSASEKSA